MLGLEEPEWDRVVVVVDRLAVLGSLARMPLSRSLGDGRIVLLTTFRKQGQNERAEVARARMVAVECAQRFP